MKSPLKPPKASLVSFKVKKSLLGLGLLFLGNLFLSSCTHLNTVTLTPIPKERDHKVFAESKRMIFFLFNFDTQFVDNLWQDLADQCPNGKVQGILTKNESITYFPLIAHAYHIRAEGYCVKTPKKAAINPALSSEFNLANRF